MWVVLFATATLVCAIGWLTRFVSCAAILYYMEKKGYTLPDNKEMEECARTVAMKIFKR